MIIKIFHAYKKTLGWINLSMLESTDNPFNGTVWFGGQHLLFRNAHGTQNKLVS